MNSLPLLLFIFSTIFLPQCISHNTTVILLHCLLQRYVPNAAILTPESPNFEPTLLSSAQNQRTLLRSPKPLLIITPTLESHAQSAVLCSKSLNFQIRTRSGGHDYEGLSYSSHLKSSSPFLILDLSNLRSISFNNDNTLWVQSGAILGELYVSIASKSPTLAFPAGSCPTVAVGGHVCGGGIGTIMRHYGAAVDHVLDIRIINHKGNILERDSMGEDLFWALRGGGGSSFGIILAYKLQLVQIPPKTTVFLKTLNLSQGVTKALASWQKEAYRADSRLYVNAILTVQENTVQVVFSALFLGEMTELLSIMDRSLSELRVTANDCKDMSWLESIVFFSIFPIPISNSGSVPNSNSGSVSSLLDRSKRFPNLSLKVKSDIVTKPIEEKSWEEICKYILKGDEHPLLLMEPLGGKLAEIAETETPFPHRNGSKFVIQHVAVWPEAGEKIAKKHIDWLRGFYDFMAPFVSKNPRAAYLNFRDLDLGKNNGEGKTLYDHAQIWGRKYYKKNFKRLAYVKAKMDPDNFFKNEQSIPPFILI